MTQESVDELQRRIAELESMLAASRAPVPSASDSTVTALLNASRDTALLLDLEGRVLAANEVAAARLGKTVAELLGQPAQAYLPPELARERLEWAMRAVETKRPMYFEDSRQGRIFENVVYPITNSDEPVKGVAVFARDVTAERHARRQQDELQRQLYQAQKMEAMGRLAGGVAHDFNNLLTAIMGNAQLLADTLGDANPSLLELDEIMEASARAAQLTRQLLAFSRKQVVETQVVNVDQAVHRSKIMLSRLVGEDVEVALEAQSEGSRTRIAPVHMDQILMNLVINSREAMPRGGRITLRTSNVSVDENHSRRNVEALPGAYVCLSVADTGEGMERERLERAFEPFYTTKDTGTGLGLSTVYGIVKQAGGFVTVDSERGAGTTFDVYLPAVTEELASEQLPKRTRSPAGGSETILLVEDEAMVRRLASRVLDKLGYRVVEAADGHEAARLGREFDGVIDLLVTDVVMPGINGKELYAELSRQRPRLRVLYSSGYNNVLSPGGMMDGNILLLPKPFTPAELATMVRSALDG